MKAATNRRVSELLLSSLRQQADQPRCGVCDQPSDDPVCYRCARLLTAERFGPYQQVRAELRRSCGGCGYFTGHTRTCPVVKR